MYACLQDLEGRRRGRRAVIRAVIFLMKQDGLDEEGAYSQLRRESMRARQNLELYCEEFLSRRVDSPDIPGRANSMSYEDLKIIEAFRFLESIVAQEQAEPGFEQALAVASVQDAMLRSFSSQRWETVGLLR